MSQFSLQFTTTEDSSKVTAPEISLGETKHTFEGDVYALGMTILEIATGLVPWAGMLDVTVVGNLTQKRHPTRPVAHMAIGDMFSDLLWELMVNCWTSDPTQRPTATRVRDELNVIRVQRALSRADRVSPSMATASTMAQVQTATLPTLKDVRTQLYRYPSSCNDAMSRLGRLFRLHSSDSHPRALASSFRRITHIPLKEIASPWGCVRTLAPDASPSQNGQSKQWTSNSRVPYGGLDQQTVYVDSLRSRPPETGSTQAVYFPAKHPKSQYPPDSGDRSLNSSLLVNTNTQHESNPILSRNTRTSGSRKALLIGSSYKNRIDIYSRFSVSSLDGFPEDFGKMESIFTERGYCVETLPDEGFDRNRILTWIAHFIDHAKSGDVRAIVFSGHGHAYEDGAVSLIPPECPSNNAAITCTEWSQNIRDHARPGVVIFSIMAHCYSGEVMKQEFDRQVWEVPSVMKPSKKDEPIYLTFAAGDKAAYESRLANNPPGHTGDHFIHALIGAIQSVNVATDTWSEFFEAFDWHFQRVRLRASWVVQESTGSSNPHWSLNHAQAPRFSASEFVVGDSLPG
ncbi:hypothetical protein B0J17DRAFT_771490 [Rhizoctonia solani]|nr:hypothetical protein B0J17DRAFT_771490 [Rhizoctonia solani]